MSLQNQRKEKRDKLRKTLQRQALAFYGTDEDRKEARLNASKEYGNFAAYGGRWPLHLYRDPMFALVYAEKLQIRRSVALFFLSGHYIIATPLNSGTAILSQVGGRTRWALLQNAWVYHTTPAIAKVMLDAAPIMHNVRLHASCAHPSHVDVQPHGAHHTHMLRHSDAGLVKLVMHLKTCINIRSNSSRH